MRAFVFYFNFLVLSDIFEADPALNIVHFDLARYVRNVAFPVPQILPHLRDLGALKLIA
jgi:hypothetical protein